MKKKHKKVVTFVCPECFSDFQFYRKELKTTPRCEFCRVKLIKGDM